tara:strand:- start:273 stop:659 length:387 start_codon:yes stop_codon:yes gene_type:complete
MFNTRSAVWNSNGIHLNTALVNGVACTGTSGHVYPLGSTLIVVDKDSSGNYFVALAKCTGEIVDCHPNEFWESWHLDNPDKVVINDVLFFAKCDNVPASVVGRTTQTSVASKNRQSVVDYVQQYGEII